jgi:hypothetical protein
MKATLAFLCAMALRLNGGDIAITVIDEDRRPLAGASIEAIFSRINDPRQSSMRSHKGQSDQEGMFRFGSGEEMCLVRLRAIKPGHFDADADHRHGLGSMPTKPQYTLTLPRSAAGVPLAFKDVLLSAESGKLPLKTWVGFDFAIGDVVAPWGKGEIRDIDIWNDGRQVGWTESDEAIESLRRSPEMARMTESRFASLHGTFRGSTRIRFERPGTGILRTPDFWPYSTLKMPPQAPIDGYIERLELSYSTLPLPDPTEDHTGFFLRIRAQGGASGKVTSAHYAKIHGRVETGYGWVAFRYYYNPVANDRRLVMDTDRNLLKPPAGTIGPELSRYQADER